MDRAAFRCTISFATLTIPLHVYQGFLYIYINSFSVFFFSSRRRHTRYWRDWSSDVCSSDLPSPGRRQSHHAEERRELQFKAPGEGRDHAVAVERNVDEARFVIVVRQRSEKRQDDVETPILEQGDLVNAYLDNVAGPGPFDVDRPGQDMRPALRDIGVNIQNLRRDMELLRVGQK